MLKTRLRLFQEPARRMTVNYRLRRALGFSLAIFTSIWLLPNLLQAVLGKAREVVEDQHVRCDLPTTLPGELLRGFTSLYEVWRFP